MGGTVLHSTVSQLLTEHRASAEHTNPERKPAIMQPSARMRAQVQIEASKRGGAESRENYTKAELDSALVKIDELRR
jgi:hypothetical protein